MTDNERRDLMEIVEKRYGSDAAMITSELTITAWHDVILDRIVQSAYRLELEGASLRKTIAKMDDEMPQTRYAHAHRQGKPTRREPARHVCAP